MYTTPRYSGMQLVVGTARRCCCAQPWPALPAARSGPAACTWGGCSWRLAPSWDCCGRRRYGGAMHSVLRLGLYRYFCYDPAAWPEELLRDMDAACTSMHYGRRTGTPCWGDGQ